MSTMLDEYIANKVQYLAKLNRKKYTDIAAALNVSESFVNKVHTFQKHYNVSHLYILSRFLNCNISEFYPTDYNTYKRLYPLSSLPESDFKNWLLILENEIKYGKDDFK